MTTQPGDLTLATHPDDKQMPMVIHLIVAMTRQQVIGSNGTLPWSIPEELQLFRRLTMGKTLIGGRHTYEAIGHPLEGRLNLVVSTTTATVVGLCTCRNLNEALARAKSADRDIFCIGGADLYGQMLPLADWLHISWIDEELTGDTRFPDFDLNDWHETDCTAFPGFQHCTYRRKHHGPDIHKGRQGRNNRIASKG